MIERFCYIKQAKTQRGSGPWQTMLWVAMHVMSRVYSFSAEYLVFTLELIQAHKTSDISTQQMYLSDYTLKGDSLHNKNPPTAWRQKQGPSEFP